MPHDHDRRDDGAAETGRRSPVDFVARDLAEAADIILRYAPASPGPVPPPAQPTLRRTAPNAGDASSSGSQQRLLQEILSTLQRLERRDKSIDFSLARLGGAIMQMAAIGALVWSAFSLNETFSVQLIRLGYAIVLQLIALTLFVTASKS